jgi:hypothetical protein
MKTTKETTKKEATTILVIHCSFNGRFYTVDTQGIALSGAGVKRYKSGAGEGTIYDVTRAALRQLQEKYSVACDC